MVRIYKMISRLARSGRSDQCVEFPPGAAGCFISWLVFDWRVIGGPVGIALCVVFVSLDTVVR